MTELTEDDKRVVLGRAGYTVRHWATTDTTWRFFLDDGVRVRESDRLGSEDDVWSWCWTHFVSGGKVYRHKKGGVYRTLGLARHADGGRVIVYEHIWPHDRGMWVRDELEFLEPGRFERL